MADQPSAKDVSKRVIKRYSNRKLYDTRDSRYVTLQQIGVMVRAGEEVQIIDNKTKEDKTEVTMALILSEDLKAEPRSVPLAALRDLIQERGGRLLDQLKDGPLGRFIERETPEETDEKNPVDEKREEKKEEKKPLEEKREERREEKKGLLSELMGSPISTLDDRIRTVIPSAKAFVDLQDEVRRLSLRIEELERKQGPRP